MRCVKVVFDVTAYPERLLEEIQQQARARAVEGCVIFQQPHTIRIIACGQGESVEAFVDFVHAVLSSYQATQMLVDPFLKDKDYRGVFRIIA